MVFELLLVIVILGFAVPIIYRINLNKVQRDMKDYAERQDELKKLHEVQKFDKF